MDNTANKDIHHDYEIEFIDPEELIDFEQEKLDSDGGQSSADEYTPELRYTHQIAEEATDYVTKKKEDTRGRLAIIYTVATFIIFLVAILVSVLDGILRQVSIIENLSVILPLISGIFLGTLGFVLGYYFRKESEI